MIILIQNNYFNYGLCFQYVAKRKKEQKTVILFDLKYPQAFIKNIRHIDKHGLTLLIDKIIQKCKAAISKF